MFSVVTNKFGFSLIDNSMYMIKFRQENMVTKKIIGQVIKLPKYRINRFQLFTKLSIYILDIKIICILAQKMFIIYYNYNEWQKNNVRKC